MKFMSWSLVMWWSREVGQTLEKRLNRASVNRETYPIMPNKPGQKLLNTFRSVEKVAKPSVFSENSLMLGSHRENKIKTKHKLVVFQHFVFIFKKKIRVPSGMGEFCFSFLFTNTIGFIWTQYFVFENRCKSFVSFMMYAMSITSFGHCIDNFTEMSVVARYHNICTIN